MTEAALRNYLGVVSFLLAALSFVAGERRDAIAALHRRGDVKGWEKSLTVASVAGLVAVLDWAGGPSTLSAPCPGLCDLDRTQN